MHWRRPVRLSVPAAANSWREPLSPHERLASRVASSLLFSEFAHHLDQVRFALEANPWKFGHRDVAVLHTNGIREAAVRLEQVRVTLIAPQAQARCDIQRHLVPAVRNAAGR